MRATSSCHRCRSRAGWRDRQVLSGCRSIDIASATYVNGRSKAALKNGGKRPFGFDVVGGTSLFRLADAADAQERFVRLASAGVLTRPFAYNPRWLRFGLPADVHWPRLEAALTEIP